MGRIVSLGGGAALALGFFGLALSTCDGGATSTCAVGSENCHCTAGAGTCDPGLVCTVDKRCVRLAGGAGTTGGGGASGGSTGGGGATGGSTGGGGQSGGSTGGGGAVVGGAVAKFCHDLTKGDQTVVLTVVIGAGGSAVRLAAATSTCSTAPGAACAAVPTGTDIPMQFLDGSTVLLSGTWPLIEAGKEYLFLGDLDDAGFPTVIGGELRADSPCKDIDINQPAATLPRLSIPDWLAPFGGTTDRSLPPTYRRASSRFAPLGR